MNTPEEAKLRETIKTLSLKIEHTPSGSISEADTRGYLIDPVLDALGWDFGTLEHVHREFKPKSHFPPFDYALMIQGSAKIIIEAKGLGERLTNVKWIRQVLGNMSEAGVAEWGVLTDGNEYYIYRNNVPLDADGKLFRKVCLRDSADEAIKTLCLLSRSNMMGKFPTPIDVEWKSQLDDRQVTAALTAMLNPENPDDEMHKGLIRLIHQKFPALKREDISAALAKVEVRSWSDVDAVEPSGVESLAQKVENGTDHAAPVVTPDPDTASPSESGYAVFKRILGSGAAIGKKEFVEQLIRESGCSENSAHNYISWAKSGDPKNYEKDRVNPFGFRIEETRDEHGNKILHKVENGAGNTALTATPEPRADSVPPSESGWAAFRRIMGSGIAIGKKEFVEQLIRESGCSEISADAYISWAKRDPKNADEKHGGNPFGFRIEESRDEHDNKILRKVD